MPLPSGRPRRQASYGCWPAGGSSSCTRSSPRRCTRRPHSSDGPDEEAARVVEAAARRARLRGAPDAAAELTELALGLVPAQSAATGELRLALAEHLFFASDFARARAVLEELRAQLEPGDLRARALLALAEIEYWRSGESAALALGEEALASAEDP